MADPISVGEEHETAVRQLVESHNKQLGGLKDVPVLGENPTPAEIADVLNRLVRALKA